MLRFVWSLLVKDFYSHFFFLFFFFFSFLLRFRIFTVIFKGTVSFFRFLFYNFFSIFPTFPILFLYVVNYLNNRLSPEISKGLISSRLQIELLRICNETLTTDTVNISPSLLQPNKNPSPQYLFIPLILNNTFKKYFSIFRSFLFFFLWQTFSIILS